MPNIKNTSEYHTARRNAWRGTRENYYSRRWKPSLL